MPYIDFIIAHYFVNSFTREASLSVYADGDSITCLVYADPILFTPAKDIADQAKAFGDIVKAGTRYRGYYETEGRRRKLTAIKMLEATHEC